MMFNIKWFLLQVFSGNDRIVFEDSTFVVEMIIDIMEKEDPADIFKVKVEVYACFEKGEIYFHIVY